MIIKKKFSVLKKSKYICDRSSLGMEFHKSIYVF